MRVTCSTTSECYYGRPVEGSSDEQSDSTLKGFLRRPRLRQSLSRFADAQLTSGQDDRSSFQALSLASSN